MAASGDRRSSRSTRSADTAGPVELTAAQVRADRIIATGLDRPASPPDLLGRLGVQDSAGWSLLALANRVGTGAGAPVVGRPDQAGDVDAVLVWSLRGSPHVHRRTELDALARSLWPRSAESAFASLAGSGSGLRSDGIDPRQALADTAGAMRSIITGPMTKGEASAAVTAAAPPECSAFCRPCGVVHVREMLFRCAALPAGIGLQPGTTPVVLEPLRPRAPARTPGEHRGGVELVAAALDRYGCVTPGELAELLGGTPADVRADLPETVAVTVDGRPAVTTPDLLDRITAGEQGRTAEVVRLLGPVDPLLAARDRAVLVPGRADQRKLWPALGFPGAVLLDGAIAGLWRAKRSGSRLDLTVEWFGTAPALSRRQRDALDREAELVADVRSAASVRLVLP
ncbi:DNA glycosylase AlkZ-like family protein [Nakamurella leprariae]|uniref:Winged helix DNA-binding domain-containing protein n=1 Tax=Nakamurella leprariae TaxID=2803911 RepID=A0A938YEM9_9ACTN|nr:crosslink repair DNA glycosylase YcaQ family protein [Nakamurella leprariae]MBM9466784.1 winged helix DNA-binding domain-containing protein [Nakamurella leprariae]